MAYIYTNTNPMKRHTNDCVIRAISLAEDRTWEDVFMDLAQQGLALCDTMEANSTWGSYLKENGWVQETLPNSCPACYTASDFCDDFSHGTYIVCTGSHVICVISGDIYDTSDTSNEIVTYYFYREEEFD